MELQNLHAYTQRHIGDELYWPGSMPAILPEEDEIPLAFYGNSNVGKLKTLYRKGLSRRYGSSMQTIAGVHYNFSFSDTFWNELKIKESSELSLKEFKNIKYFHMIRNFKRHSWMLMYLFGASPVVHASFLEGKNHNLEKLSDNTYFTPKGISLRMGGLGYTSSVQKQITVCFDRLETYIKTIENARLESHPLYESIGIVKNGEYQQLNTNIIQIDNEFYSTIRPKNIAHSRESALKALHLRGVEYIEVRLLDNNPFAPLGATKEQINFLHLFLAWCLVSESPLLTDKENKEIDENFQRVVTQGRDASLKLLTNGKDISLADLLKEKFDSIEACTKTLLDQPDYQIAFSTQLLKVEDPQKIPSVQVMNEIAKYDNDYIKFNMAMATKFNKSYVLEEKSLKELDELGAKSILDQKVIEQNDKLEFDDFLKKYFSDILINFEE